MATDYSLPQSRAEAMLKDKGEAMQLMSYVKEHDPVDGTNTTAIIATFDIYGVSLPASESLRQKFQSGYIEGLAHKHTEFLIVSAKGVEFDARANNILFKAREPNKHFEVLGATPLKPTDTSILYWLMVTPVDKKFEALKAVEWNTMQELNEAITALIET